MSLAYLLVFHAKKRKANNERTPKIYFKIWLSSCLVQNRKKVAYEFIQDRNHPHFWKTITLPQIFRFWTKSRDTSTNSMLKLTHIQFGTLIILFAPFPFNLISRLTRSIIHMGGIYTCHFNIFIYLSIYICI